MFSFLKNIINTVIILLAILGVFFLCKNNVFDSISNSITNIFSMDKEQVESEVGDFSKVDEEFNIDKAVKIVGYKTVVAKHQTTGQKMIIVDSGKKSILTTNDITSDKIEEKLTELCKKFKYHSAVVEKIEITDKGYLSTYGRQVPYVKFSAKITNFPKSKIRGIISAVDNDKNNQRLIISLNDEKHYSQLITSEFYKNVKESKIGK